MKLKIENVKKSFDKKEVLKGVNYTFEKGKIYGLLGKNGSGKTTLFNCLNQDLPVDEGTFLLEKETTKKVTPNDIGYVLSTPTVPEFLTGEEFLKFFLEINEKNLKEVKTVSAYFDFIKIEEEDRGKLLKDYSHGMKNKMQMLINFIANPDILLLDEPLTSLDVVVAEEMKQILKEMKQDHIIIFSTHIMELALDLCDDIVVLSQGKLSKVEKDNLEEKEFKEKIIALLKEEYND